MIQRGLRPFALLVTLSTLLAALAPGVGGRHNDLGQHDPSDPGVDAAEVVPDLPVRDPTLDQARREILERQREAIALARAALASRGGAVETVAPVFAARVFEDPVDPGGRIGGIGNWQTIGGAWRVAPGLGVNASAAWTMTDAATGRYESVDAMLVSPALDLSAYLLQMQDAGLATAPPSALPCTRGETATRGSPVADTVEVGCQGAALVDRNQALETAREQLVLLLRHRHSFPAGTDGGQVYVYTRDPALSDSRARLLTPLQGAGVYASDVAALDGPGFTGSRAWETAAFDLTRYAGRTVWIAFRVATSSAASADPLYFAPSNFPGGAPYGWIIDDLLVTAPAAATNLKIHAIEGPDFATDPDDPVTLVAAGANATVGLVVVNAAARAGLANATIEVRGLEEGTRVWNFSRVLRPGDVWTPNVTVTAPGLVGSLLEVFGRVVNPAPDGRPMADPTPDNEKRRAFRIRNVHDVDVEVRASEAMVDYGAPVDALVAVTNRGNVPMEVALALTETVPATGEATASAAPRGGRSFALAPGATGAFAARVSSAARGEHVIRAVASSSFGSWTGEALYYVHASPPPIYHGTSTEDGSAWTPQQGQYTPPAGDDWLWVARAADGVGVQGFAGGDKNVLRALPAPEATTGGRGTRYFDLELEMTYFALSAAGTRVDLAYVRPLAVDTGLPSAMRQVVWSYRLPLVNTPYMRAYENFSWDRLSVPVEPPTEGGYVDLWSLKGLELDVEAVLLNEGGSQLNQSMFAIAELRLTGIPEGGDASMRRALITITGEEPYVPQAAPGTVGPPLPSRCWWEQRNVPVISALRVNCWRRLPSEDLLNKSRISSWSTVSSLGANVTIGRRAAMFQYERDVDDRPLDRVYSPVIRVGEAPNLTLTFEHAVQFPAIPYDIRQPATGNDIFDYRILQAGFVEFQYRRDDGSWSRFYRIVPEGGYGSVLEFAPSGTARKQSSGQSLEHGDGFYHPVSCPEKQGVDGPCLDGGYIHSFDRHPHLTLTWMQFERSPLVSRATFAIDAGGQYLGPGGAALDLSNRDVRLAFTATPWLPAGGPMKASWTIGDVRLTPVGKFAVDGAVENVTLDLPYAWRTLGVGPGTNVTVNVTVANVGLFPEDFSIRLEAAVLAGETLLSRSQPVGRLGPGERRFVPVEWPVPEVDGRFYEIRAVIVPTDEAIADDNPVQDARTLGADGALFAKRRLDAGAFGLAYPSLGRAELARLLDVTVYNRGNIALDGLVLERTVERLDASGRSLVETRSWKVTETLAPDPGGLPFRSLETSPPKRPEDDFLTPGEAGLYAMTIVLKLPSGLEDDRPADNEHKSFFRASESLVFDDFEGPFGWTTNAPHVWGDGPGFRSLKGLAAANRSGGPLPAEGDFWVESPPIPLSSAESATVNFFTRYDFENGYDGGRVEVSVDGGLSWLPAEPSIPGRAAASYPGEIIGVTALADPGRADPVAAFTGSSSSTPGHLDGWIPVSINLGRLEPLVNEAEFLTLDAPRPVAGEPIAPLGGGFYGAPWMNVTGPAEFVPRRWSIENLTEGIEAREGAMWWSGFANAGALGPKPRHERVFSIAAANVTDDLTLSWWDWRPGNSETLWKGVGGRFEIEVAQPDDLENWLTIADDRDVRDTGSEGPWHRLEIDLEGFEPSRPLRVSFTYNAYEVSVGNLGWAIENFSFDARRVQNGTRVVVAAFAGAEEDDTGAWTSSWQRIARLAPRSAGWNVIEATGPEGLTRPQWRLKPGANLDSRLVTPEVDLAGVGGASASLVLKHQHNLRFVDTTTATHFSKSRWFGRHYQGAAVEVQMFNRTTGAWDPWRPLFEDAEGPTQARVLRIGTSAGATGAPYDAVISDADDTFTGYPRKAFVTFVNDQNLVYDRGYDVDVAYVFTGDSKGFRTSRFDLTPYIGERVRFGFHAYSTPVDPDFAKRFWQIGSMSLSTRVLSTNDAKLRFHLATDASVGEGRWEIDQFEVNGRSYRRSVGIHLDPVPATVASTGIRVTGVLTNYGPEPRASLAIGVRAISGGLAGVDPLGETGRVVVPGYVGAAGEFDLAPAGTPGASVPFEILVRPGSVGSTPDVVFEVLEGSGFASRTYATVADDVPGRARARLALTVSDTVGATFAVAGADPVWLPGSGNASAVGEVLNDGTLDVGPLTVLARWTNEAGQLVTTTSAQVPRLKAGARASFATGDAVLTAPGNYTIEFKITNGATTLDTVTRTLRVARGDVALASGFEGSFEGWTTSGPLLKVAKDDAAYGASSALFGYTNAETADGLALAGESATLTSPALDLRTFPEGSALTFWYKSALGAGTVAVTCRGIALAEASGATLKEIRPGWSFARMPIPESCRTQGTVFAFAFAQGPMGQGWRLDGVQVEAYGVSIEPGPREGTLLDSARKAYAFVVENPGLAPRDLVFSIDPRQARVTPEQLAWMSVEPPRLALDPGDRATVLLKVDAPPARGAFRQSLLPALAATDASAPFAPAVGRLGLVFDPAPRADLAAGVSLDGRPAGAARVPLEEAIPHEVSVVVTNQGVVPSVATEVHMAIFHDETGELVWERRENVEGLEPFSASETSALATASWKPAYGARGNYTLRVAVDPGRALVDYDRSNDAFDVPLAVVPLVRPDLAVDARNLTIATPDGLPLFEALPGEILAVQGTVSNVGLAAARDVTVRLLAGSAILKEEKIDVLPAGAAHTVRTNHFAGSETTTYRLLAFTRDLEIFSTNNEQAVDIPVFPPDVAIEPRSAVAIEPGASATLYINVTNAAPFPSVLAFSLAGEAGLGRLRAREVPFGAGETRTVELGIRADPLERAGERRVLLVAESSEGKRTERSIPVDVAARPGVTVVPYLARGPPTGVGVSFEVVNTGNVPVEPVAVVRLGNGTLAGTQTVGPVLPGKSTLAHVRAVLDEEAPPARENATIEIELPGGALASVPIALDVAPWGRISARAKAAGATETSFTYDLALRYEGNAPTARVPHLIGLPPGARASFDPPIVRALPGETPTLRLAVETTNATPSGLYRLRAVFLEAESETTDPAAALEEAASLTMDLRRGRLAIRSVTRDPADSVTSGETVSFGIALANDGDRPVEAVPIALYVDGVLVARDLVDVDVVGEAVARLSWKATPGRHAVVVAVDPFGPHASDTAARPETLEVEASLLDAEAARRSVPATAALALVAVAFVLAALRRDRRRDL